MSSKYFRAFTLVELLIALSVLSIVAALSYTSFVSVRKVADLSRKDEEAQRSTRGLVERLDLELSSALYRPYAKETLFVSERKEVGGKTVNTLSFTTVLPQSSFEIGHRGEVIRIEYSVGLSENEPERYVVLKKVFFNTLTVEEKPEPFEFVVGGDFSRFLFRFYKGGRWYESWDTAQMNALPDGVEFTFSLGERTYREYFNVFLSGS